MTKIDAQKRALKSEEPEQTVLGERLLTVLVKFLWHSGEHENQQNELGGLVVSSEASIYDTMLRCNVPDLRTCCDVL